VQLAVGWLVVPDMGESPTAIHARAVLMEAPIQPAGIANGFAVLTAVHVDAVSGNGGSQFR